MIEEVLSLLSFIISFNLVMLSGTTKDEYKELKAVSIFSLVSIFLLAIVHVLW